LAVNSVSTDERLSLLVYKNGSVYSAINFGSSSATANAGGHISDSIYLEAGDYLEAYVDSVADTSYSVESDFTQLSIQALPDFSTFSTYGPYEYLEAEITTSTETDSSSYVDVTGASLIVTPGTWLVCFEIETELRNLTGVTVTVELRYRITDDSNNLIGNLAGRRFEKLDNNDRYIIHQSKCQPVEFTETETIKLRITNSSGTNNELARVNSNSPAANRGSFISARRLK
jgi:hypothetical protein